MRVEHRLFPDIADGTAMSDNAPLTFLTRLGDRAGGPIFDLMTHGAAAGQGRISLCPPFKT
jgi:hypothetical protein